MRDNQNIQVDSASRQLARPAGRRGGASGGRGGASGRKGLGEREGSRAEGAGPWAEGERSQVEGEGPPAEAGDLVRGEGTRDVFPWSSPQCLTEGLLRGVPVTCRAKVRLLVTLNQRPNTGS